MTAPTFSTTDAAAAPNRANAPAIKLRDRRLEFERARRHSAKVRILKVVLPLLVAGILILYTLPALTGILLSGGKDKVKIKAIALEAGALKMLNPRVTGVNDAQGAYDITADSATQEAKNASVMFLDKIHGTLTAQDGKVTTLNAPNAVYDSKGEEMTFNNGAVVEREPGLSARFQTVTVMTKQQLVVSRTPVVVRLHDSTIEAQTMTLHTGDQQAVFEGNVRTHIERQPGAGLGK